MSETIEKAVFTTVEAVLGWYKPVYVRERPDKSSFNLCGAVKHVEACLRSIMRFPPLWRPCAPEKIEKAVLTNVVAL